MTWRIIAPTILVLMFTNGCQLRPLATESKPHNTLSVASVKIFNNTTRFIETAVLKSGDFDWEFKYIGPNEHKTFGQTVPRIKVGPDATFRLVFTGDTDATTIYVDKFDLPESTKGVVFVVRDENRITVQTEE